MYGPGHCYRLFCPYCVGVIYIGEVLAMGKALGWLPAYVKTREISVRQYADGMGVPESTARHHIRAGRVPFDDGAWERIEKFLCLPPGTARMNFMGQLQDEGRIKGCIICADEIIVWKSNVLCKKLDCRRVYDRNRKALKRGKLNLYQDKKPSTFNRDVYKPSKSLSAPVIDREYINSAVDAFLSGGGVIEKQVDGHADVIDPYDATDSSMYKHRLDLTLV